MSHDIHWVLTNHLKIVSDSKAAGGEHGTSLCEILESYEGCYGPASQNFSVKTIVSTSANFDACVR